MKFRRNTGQLGGEALFAMLIHGFGSLDVSPQEGIFKVVGQSRDPITHLRQRI
jgi:hypothetical protein